MGSDKDPAGDAIGRTGRMSRRTFLGRTATAASLTGVAGPLAACQPPKEGGTQGGRQGNINLDFVIWTYGLETVASNIEKFEKRYPSISVNLSDFSWTRYHDMMVNRFNSKTGTDVAYNGGNWLPEFAAAGWVVPLEDHFEWVQNYKDKTFDFAWQDMVWDGKVCGLPYYADTMSFLYNEKVLEDAGISNPPQTWEELTEQATALQRGGMQKPFIIEVAQDLPSMLEAYLSMVFGRGGELIDDGNNPVWTDSSSPAAQQLDWLAQAANEDNILASAPHETDVVRAMSTGQHAFTVLYNYNLASLNNPATSDLAGQFRLGLMPGETHECYGFSKFYSMTQMAVARGGDVVDASGKFIEYFSGQTDGEYVVAKRWALESGLGFGQKPLFEDPEVRESLSQWMDLDTRRRQLTELARAARHTVWYGIWGQFFRRQYLGALGGDKSPQGALEASAREWQDLRERYEN